ncbi:hypothetical protein SAMN02745166_01082 [Prosthecobacter debontii]|uniref:Glycosyltransferase n=1 Tax=Prosthecobacter debontii TaxID=48467 RepID=A0A1T4X5S3_9BACT|nr:hypothetical protein [Prosthecobacter debontii]SKA84983.1 hypothetical protein SAMN02745166_01082 [Prosthecobacter debontii]
MIRRSQTQSALPPPRKLAVITCFFNFAGFKRPRANCLRFLRAMERQGIPVFGVEAVLPNQIPVLADAPNWRVILADPQKHVIWQKEALLNVALGMVPPEYTAIAWVDSDLDFMNPHWVSQTEQALMAYDVVQPFHEAFWSHEDGSIERRHYCSTMTGLDQQWKGHPGFAWAARREILERAEGLYPRCVLGSGDTLMAAAFLDSPLWHRCEQALGTRQDLYLRWRLQLGRVSTGYVHGQIWHEHHGSRENRRYDERIDLIRDLDCVNAVTVDENGLLSWTEAASPEVREAVAHYFIGRREDG